MRLPLHRSLAVSLALTAMVLRALLPDGWMPSSDAGVTPFVICSADATHAGGKAPAQPGREHTHAPCAFAAAAPLSPPTANTPALRAPLQASRLAFVFASDRRSAASRFSLNSARAPPAFS